MSLWPSLAGEETADGCTRRLPSGNPLAGGCQSVGPGASLATPGSSPFGRRTAQPCQVGPPLREDAFPCRGRRRYVARALSHPAPWRPCPPSTRPRRDLGKLTPSASTPGPRPFGMATLVHRVALLERSPSRETAARHTARALVHASGAPRAGLTSWTTRTRAGVTCGVITCGNLAPYRHPAYTALGWCYQHLQRLKLGPR